MTSSERDACQDKNLATSGITDHAAERIAKLTAAYPVVWRVLLKVLAMLAKPQIESDVRAVGIRVRML